MNGRAEDSSSSVGSPRSVESPFRLTLGQRSGQVIRSIGQYNQLGVLVALLAMVGFVSAFHPSFLSPASLINIAEGAALYGIIALGMVFLLSMREIDLSVGSIYAVSITASALLIALSGWNPWLAAAAGVGLSVALGALNGVLSNVIGIPTIIVTLGTLSMYRGLTLVLAGGHYVPYLPASSFFEVLGGNLLGVPVSVWAFGLLAVVLTVLYRSTRFGFVVRAIGSNQQAAVLSGIPVGRIKLITLALVGGLCGIAGMLTLALFQSADSNLGTGYELLAIAAAIIGGTGLSGGSGSVSGALIGALIIATIQGGLVQFGINPNWSSFVTGAVIIAAVAIDAIVRRQRTLHT